MGLAFANFPKNGHTKVTEIVACLALHTSFATANLSMETKSCRLNAGETEFRQQNGFGLYRFA